MIKLTNKIKVIIVLVVLGILLVWCIVATSIGVSLNNKYNTLKSEKNILSQSIEKYIKENAEKDIIINNKNELLKEVNNATSFKEFKAVWKKINKELTR